MLRIALAAAAFLATTPADAQPRRTFAMARVPIGDLNLATDAGARTMVRRLWAAAGQICAYTPSALLPREPGRAHRCRREAVAAAVDRLKAPRLVLAYAEFLTEQPPANP